MLLIIALEVIKKLVETAPVTPTKLTGLLDIISIFLFVLFIFILVIAISLPKAFPEE